MRKPSNGTRSTIADVAAAAGVSPATVSRVMNNRSVSDELARRVRQVAAELHYRPSDVARSLSLGRTRTVGVVVPYLGNPTFQETLRGLSETAALEDYSVLVTETDEDQTVEPAMARDARARCDAIVLVSPGASDEVLHQLVAELEPVVVLGRGIWDRSGTPSLSVDFTTGIVALMDHLIQLGHREFVYLSGPAVSAGNLARLKGLEQVQAAHPRLRITHLSCGSRMEHGHAAAERVLASQATAVVGYNDLVAFGLLARLNEIGVAVPQDLSVAGMDDIALAGFAGPPLTTLSVPATELGRRAWSHLSARIRQETVSEAGSFVPQLVERESTGPAAPRRRSEHRRVVARRDIDTVSWHAEREADVLMGDGLPLLRYERGSQLASVHAPRPYAHPIHSLSGVPLTTAGPRLHRHQHGLSLAVPDVNGTSYWGGRTFVQGVGSTLLANHGRQVVLERSSEHGGDPRTAELVESLRWEDEYGGPWLSESRSIAGVLLPELPGWMLRWRSELRADTGDITFASPATHGRHGAGYGGIYWRFDAAAVHDIFSELGHGEHAVHGRTTPWVALVRAGPQGHTTVILRQPAEEVLPWFCRVTDYTGLGPAIAWDSERTLHFGSAMQLSLDALILDRAVEADEAPGILAEHAG